MSVYKNMDNPNLIKAYRVLCYRITNYPNNKTIGSRLLACEKEICNRLGVDPEELKDD